MEMVHLVDQVAAAQQNIVLVLVLLGHRDKETLVQMEVLMLVLVVVVEGPALKVWQQLVRLVEMAVRG
jgi:hypothetical protein